MRVEKLDVEGAFAFSPPVYRDERGLFTSPFREDVFAGAVRDRLFPVRDVSHNVSARGVLRGVHYTAAPPGRAKYVYCPHGRVLDFLVDLRAGSPTFGRYHAGELGGDDGRALYVPVGVGHAFLALEDASVVVYLMSEGYVPGREHAVDCLDPALGLPLPDGVTPVRSPRDLAAPALEEAAERGLLPDYTACREAEDRLWP
ncbi:dTDP-4-dehydrorhamnose 3,5-epimerase [Streptomyces caatingaensis]|uniref:dTDP-4-dehydrorhamnose 3,5-epimerase n=1 Tax=Streptomyces caatingaensis TaxID=1678637 RepID=A0A0K9XFI6_9ACTN|nr:dTDP-4-dehydrorhamnose 3,5-epimerase family protein [Streptomyces caatingaensis]KNB52164.1 dTDP-4-dehydrorhamnose 3,5-epimerase [Streptomyces caatingaensis]